MLTWWRWFDMDMYEDLFFILTIPFIASITTAVVYYFISKVDLPAIYKSKAALLCKLSIEARNREIAALQMSKQEKLNHEKHARKIIQGNICSLAPRMVSSDPTPTLGFVHEDGIKVHVSQEALGKIYHLRSVPYVFTIYFSFYKGNEEKEYELTITNPKDVNYAYIEQEINESMIAKAL